MPTPAQNQIITGIVKRRVERHAGLGGIFKHLRAQKQFDLVGDLPVLKMIILALRDHGLRFSNAEVYRAFKLVDKSEYFREDRHQIFDDLFGRGR